MCGGSGAVMSSGLPRARMRDDDPARQQMQLVLDAARQLPVLDVEIFRIADDRMSDMRRVGAQLVGAPGDGLQRQPGELWSRPFRRSRNRSARGSRPRRRACDTRIRESPSSPSFAK